MFKMQIRLKAFGNCRSLPESKPELLCPAPLRHSFAPVLPLVCKVEGISLLRQRRVRTPRIVPMFIKVKAQSNVYILVAKLRYRKSTWGHLTVTFAGAAVFCGGS